MCVNLRYIYQFQYQTPLERIYSSQLETTTKRASRLVVLPGMANDEGAPALTGAAREAFTKFGPQLTLTCIAADAYVLAMALARSALAASNISIVFCRQVLHVGWLPPGKLVLSGR